MTNTKTAKVATIEEQVAALPTPKRVGGDVTTFRTYTARLAPIFGWTVTKADGGAVFTRGDDRLVVTYSERNYVRKVVGTVAGKPVSILPGHADKWIGLNRLIATPAS